MRGRTRNLSIMSFALRNQNSGLHLLVLQTSEIPLILKLKLIIGLTKIDCGTKKIKIMILEEPKSIWYKVLL